MAAHKNNKTHKIIFVLLALFAIFAIALRKDKTYVGLDFNSLNLLQIAGKEEEMKGPFLLHYFATWCEYCRNDAILQSKNLLDVDLYGVLVADDPRNLHKFSKTYFEKYEKIFRINVEKNSKDYNSGAIPYTLLVGKDGKVVYHHEGSFDKDEIRNALLPIIQKERAK
jgi:thiol-disulfide isomerase/thioredoxin